MGKKNPRHVIEIETRLPDMGSQLKKYEDKLIGLQTSLANNPANKQLEKKVQTLLNKISSLKESYNSTIKELSNAKLDSSQFDKFSKTVDSRMEEVSERMTQVEKGLSELSQELTSFNGGDALKKQVDKMSDQMKNFMRDMKDSITMLKDFQLMVGKSLGSEELKAIAKAYKGLDNLDLFDFKGIDDAEDQLDSIQEELADTYQDFLELREVMNDKNASPTILKDAEIKMANLLPKLSQLIKTVAKINKISSNDLFESGYSFDSTFGQFNLDDAVMEIDNETNRIKKVLSDRSQEIQKQVETIEGASTKASSFTFKDGGIKIPVILDPKSKEHLESSTKDLIELLNKYTEHNPVDVVFRLFPMSGTRADEIELAKNIKDIRAQIPKTDDKELQEKLSSFVGNLEKEYQQALKVRIAIELSQKAEDVEKDLKKIREAAKKADVTIQPNIEISESESNKLKKKLEEIQKGFSFNLTKKITDMSESLTKLLSTTDVKTWSSAFTSALDELKDKLEPMAELIKPLTDLLTPKKNSVGRPSKETIENRSYVEAFTVALNSLNKALSQKEKLEAKTKDFIPDIQADVDKSNKPVIIPIKPKTAGFIEEIQDAINKEGVSVNVGQGSNNGSGVSLTPLVDDFYISKGSSTNKNTQDTKKNTQDTKKQAQDIKDVVDAKKEENKVSKEEIELQKEFNTVLDNYLKFMGDAQHAIETNNDRKLNIANNGMFGLSKGFPELRDIKDRNISKYDREELFTLFLKRKIGKQRTWEDYSLDAQYEMFKKFANDKRYNKANSKELKHIVESFRKYQENGGTGTLEELTNNKRVRKNLVNEYNRQTKAIEENTAKVKENESAKENIIDNSPTIEKETTSIEKNTEKKKENVEITKGNTDSKNQADAAELLDNLLAEANARNKVAEAAKEESKEINKINQNKTNSSVNWEDTFDTWKKDIQNNGGFNLRTKDGKNKLKHAVNAYMEYKANNGTRDITELSDDKATQEKLKKAYDSATSSIKKQVETKKEDIETLKQEKEETSSLIEESNKLNEIKEKAQEKKDTKKIDRNSVEGLIQQHDNLRKKMGEYQDRVSKGDVSALKDVSEISKEILQVRDKLKKQGLIWSASDNSFIKEATELIEDNTEAQKENLKVKQENDKINDSNQTKNISKVDNLYWAHEQLNIKSQQTSYGTPILTDQNSKSNKKKVEEQTEKTIEAINEGLDNGIDAHSDSKRSDKSGENFVNGFTHSIEEHTPEAVDAAENLGKQVSDKLDEVVDGQTSRFNDKFTRDLLILRKEAINKGAYLKQDDVDIEVSARFKDDEIEKLKTKSGGITRAMEYGVGKSGKGHVKIPNGTGDLLAHTHYFKEGRDNLVFAGQDIERIVDEGFNEAILMCGEELLTMDLHNIDESKRAEMKNDIVAMMSNVLLLYGAKVSDNNSLHRDDLPDEISNEAVYVINSLLQEIVEGYGGTLSYQVRQGNKIVDNTNRVYGDFPDTIREFLDLVDYYKTQGDQGFSAIDIVSKDFLSIDELKPFRENQIAEGIKNAQEATMKIIKEGAIKGTRKAQDSSSPSKVAEALGGDWGQGYANGILKSKEEVEAAVRDLVTSGKMTAEGIIKDLPNIGSEEKYKDLLEPATKIGSEMLNYKPDKKTISSLKGQITKIGNQIANDPNIDAQKYAELAKRAEEYVNRLKRLGVETSEIEQKFKDTTEATYQKFKPIDTSESVEAVDKEAEKLEEIPESAKKASKSKEEFADANKQVLSSIVESLKGLDAEGNGFANLNKLINNLGGKSGGDKLQKTVEGLKAIYDVLNQDVSDNALIKALTDLASKGTDLENLATILKASKKQITTAKKELDTSNQDNLKSIMESVDVSENARNYLSEYGEVVNLTQELKNGFIQVTSTVLAADDTFKRYTLTTKDGVEMTISKTEEHTTGLEKEINLYAKLLRAANRLKALDEPNPRSTDEVFIEKDSALWNDVLEYAKEYGEDLGNILSITRSVREANGEMLESFKIVGENGSVTIGAENDVVGSIQKIQDVTKQYKELLDLRNKLSSTDLKNTQKESFTPEYISQIREMINLIDSAEFDLTNPADVARLEKMVADAKELDAASKNMDNTLGNMKQLDKLRGKIADILNDYGAMSRELKDNFNSLKSTVEYFIKAGRISSAQADEINAKFLELNANLSESGKKYQSLGRQMLERLRSQSSQLLAQYFSFQDFIRYGRTAVSTIIDLDTQLVDLRKTTKMNNDELEQFYYNANQVAKRMGVTTSEIISQASAWSRLGFNTKEASTQMAEISSKFASISPGMTTENATDYLVSTIQAYGLKTEEVERTVLDNVNAVGNAFATTNAEIGEMLTRSSAAMKEANNTLEETIALETAAVEITRNAERTGTAFRTVSMRIRGYDEEGEDGELLEDYEELKGKIADLTKTAKTPGGISLFTDETKQTYKSTYQLLKEISEIYHDLTDKEQAGLLEALAGDVTLPETIDNIVYGTHLIARIA